MLVWAKKNTTCFVAIKSDFVVVSTVTTIFKRHCSTLILELNTYLSSANIRLFTTIVPTVHHTLAEPSWIERLRVA